MIVDIRATCWVSLRIERRKFAQIVASVDSLSIAIIRNLLVQVRNLIFVSLVCTVTKVIKFRNNMLRYLEELFSIVFNEITLQNVSKTISQIFSKYLEYSP